MSRFALGMIGKTGIIGDCHKDTPSSIATLTMPPPLGEAVEIGQGLILGFSNMLGYGAWSCLLRFEDARNTDGNGETARPLRISTLSPLRGIYGVSTGGTIEDLTPLLTTRPPNHFLLFCLLPNCSDFLL